MSKQRIALNECLFLLVYETFFSYSGIIITYSSAGVVLLMIIYQSLLMLCSTFDETAKCFRKHSCRVTINQYGVLRALEYLCWTAHEGQFDCLL